MSDIIAATPSATPSSTGLSAPNWRGHAAHLAAALRRATISAMPLIVVLVVILGTWQIAADHPTASLPAPTKIWPIVGS